MKFLRTALLALLPIVASAGLIVQSGPRLFVEPSEQVETGSLVTTGIIDEVTDRLDILVEGTAADVGAGDFTFSFWLKPNATGNDTGAQTTGVGYKFPDTDIVIDRDNLPTTTRDYGCGLAAGRFGCSVENSNGAYSVFATTDIRDAQWHHIYWQRSASNGLLEIWVDSIREVSDTGPTGTISLPAGCAGAECYLVFYTEKHGFQVEGYKGKGGPIEIWDTLVCSGATCTVPSAPSNPAASGLVAQYNMGEGSGTAVGDTAGTNDGFIAAGGVPAWSTDTPYP